VDRNRVKTIAYVRAVWLNPTTSRTLESYIREATKLLKTAEERIVERNTGQKLRMIAYSELDKNILLHIAADTPGEHASVVPTPPPNSAEIKLRTVPPPNDAEYMDGDAFMFVSKNHVCLCNSNLREKTVSSFPREIFKNASLTSISQQFNFMKVASIQKLKMIESSHVVEVRLRSTVQSATASYIRRNAQTQGVISAAARHIKMLFGNINDVNDDGLNIEVTIKTDRRDRKHLAESEKRAENLAIKLINEQEPEDEYLIVLANGQTISQSEINVRTHANIESFGKSVDRDKAWDALRDCFDYLVENGIIEQ
jgi:hypothetical protein